jgi:hypothetical protein
VHLEGPEFLLRLVILEGLEFLGILGIQLHYLRLLAHPVDLVLQYYLVVLVVPEFLGILGIQLRC